MDEDASPALAPHLIRNETNEHHAIFGNGSHAIHLLLAGSDDFDRPLAAVIPLGAEAFDRLEAVTRLLKTLTQPSSPDDTRLTLQRRRRLRHMMQAFDGHASKATYREIAGVIFGVSRIAADAWKTSPLRDASIRLVRDGMALVDGGYRDLLRWRHRR